MDARGAACLGWCLLVLGACAGGGGGGAAPTTTAPMPTAYETDDLFRKGDFVRVTLTGVPQGEEAVTDTKVDEQGNIAMKHIGSLRAEGLNSAQLKEKIETMYKLARIYSNPVVRVESQQARYVTVMGEVRGPQKMYHAKDLTALSAIATCGGFSEYADRDDVEILRGGQVIRFNAKRALKNTAEDIPLLPDDKINVKRAIF
jgi:polysaccharide biosynthesis/export protein